MTVAPGGAVARRGDPKVLRQVVVFLRRDFTVRRMPYDAALSWLGLSVLLLNAGRAAEVRELAVRMVRILKGQEELNREALGALQLFCNAARQETATAELALRVIADIKQARRSAPPDNQGRGRG